MRVSTDGGVMRVVLTTFNAKYIHTSLALRLLYVANKDKFDLSFREYVIKEGVENAAVELLSAKPDVIGISVSIWNVEQSRLLACALREKQPGIILILGGPEVTYDATFFLESWPVDYVIKGEGEFVLGELLTAIENHAPTNIKGVSSIRYPDNTIAKADPAELEKLPSPYMLEEDRPEMKNRLVYFESSRGCPYQCAYCLSSLEKGVRYFSEAYIEKNLRYLLRSEAQQIKFLDRTFNLNPTHTSFIFRLLIQEYRPALSCQFEIYADLLTDEAINYLNEQLPENYFRFEIGIQSTYEPSNLAVRRKQNFPLLAGNVHKLMKGGKVDIHLDLIAGLPHENLERFIQSFNDVFALKAKEVQLGFLKMLRGTDLRENASSYGYVYNEKAPYEIISNDAISAEELNRIHEAEHMLDIYWNSGRFGRTMRILVEEHYKDMYFELFDEIARFYKVRQYPLRGYQLEDLYRNLNLFLQTKGIDLLRPLRTDYYGNYTIRPSSFWTDTLDKKKRKQLLYLIGQDKEFLALHKLDRKVIEKQAVIDPVGENEYLLTLFLPEWDKKEHPTLRYRMR